jgi:hypothetical protein
MGLGFSSSPFLRGGVGLVLCRKKKAELDKKIKEALEEEERLKKNQEMARKAQEEMALKKKQQVGSSRADPPQTLKVDGLRPILEGACRKGCFRWMCS